MTIQTYLLSSVARSPEGEGSAPPPPPDEGSDREILAFDPGKFFAPPAQEGKDGGEGEDPASGGDADPASGAASSQAGSPSPSPDPAKPIEGEDDPLKALREAVSGFLDKKPAVEEAKPAPAEKPAASEPPKGSETPAPAYEFSLPDEIVNGMVSDEPADRRKALNAVVNGLANKLAKDFSQAMAVMAQHVQKEAVAAALGQVDGRTQEQKVRDDFYGTFSDIKELADNLPAIDSVVWQTAQQIATATGKKGWDKELRDQVGNTLRLQLKLPTAAAPPAKPGGREPRKPTFNAGGGTSGTGRPNGAGEANEFLSVLGAGQG